MRSNRELDEPVKVDWTALGLFITSFGMAGLMIIGLITSLHWLASKFH